MSNKFRIVSDFQPSGDQPDAIFKLVKGLNDGFRDQVLLGITGSGKTFTMANIIQATNRPSIIVAHNKTLAAQLYEEMSNFFPENRVEYFVSYYDYYQPEAYVPQTDIFIEKDVKINEQLERLKHSATRALFERKDVIVVSSVSCIYGIGEKEHYLSTTLSLSVGDKINMYELGKKLTELQYKRSKSNLVRGEYRVVGEIIDIFPAHYKDRIWRIVFFENEIEKIYEADSNSIKKIIDLQKITIFANSHYVTPKPTLEQATKSILKELNERLEFLSKNNKLLEYNRLEKRIRYDVEMMLETNSCKGIENYSQYLSSRDASQPPSTLLEYLPKDAIMFIDESHMTVPQINAMYAGDQSRKRTLIEYGFRLPSALNNRPLKFSEWDKIRPQTIFVSATPGRYEVEISDSRIVNQVIRPTGLLDPKIEIKPAAIQVEDLISECKKEIKKNNRVLVVTLTKKMAENLSEYLFDTGIKNTYLHSEIKTIERVEIISKLRTGEIDVLIGVNLLREGLDIPECSLIAILDGDKEGFLRSETSLLQTIGRAARNIDGRVIIYADKKTKSIEGALSITNQRREMQEKYNKDNNITPRNIKKIMTQKLNNKIMKELGYDLADGLIADSKESQEKIKELTQIMHAHADNLNFEEAKILRDKIKELKQIMNK